eukprot:29665-Rhodomonas_salina.1
MQGQPSCHREHRQTQTQTQTDTYRHRETETDARQPYERVPRAQCRKAPVALLWHYARGPWVCVRVRVRVRVSVREAQKT